MKLVRFGKEGREKPGIIDSEGFLRDLSTKVKDIDGKTISSNSLKLIQRVNLKKLSIVKGKPRIGVPIANIGKIVCIGLNYVDHAKEVGSPLPKEPIMFLKPTSSSYWSFRQCNVAKRPIVKGKRCWKNNRKQTF